MCNFSIDGSNIGVDTVILVNTICVLSSKIEDFSSLDYVSLRESF